MLPEWWLSIPGSMALIFRTCLFFVRIRSGTQFPI